MGLIFFFWGGCVHIQTAYRWGRMRDLARLGSAHVAKAGGRALRSGCLLSSSPAVLREPLAAPLSCDLSKLSASD